MPRITRVTFIPRYKKHEYIEIICLVYGRIHDLIQRIQI